MIAHRGASHDAPENSLEAFEAALEQGADYVEFDVRRAADGTLVVNHNPVRSDPSPEMPTLDDILAALSGRIGLAVDIKEAESVLGTLSALGAHGAPTESLLVLSRHIRCLWHARRVRPDLRYLLHLGPRPDPTAATRLWGVTYRDDRATPGQLALARSLGLARMVWTVNDPARMEQLAGLEVDGIFTDRPALLREVAARVRGGAPG